MANVALFSTLPQRGDLIVHDALIHASVHDGMRAGKAERAEARHNDAQAFEDAIKDWRAAGGTGTPWIAVESLYSMDGDRAPLDDLDGDRRRATTACSSSTRRTRPACSGPTGAGSAPHLEGRDNVITLHTCGKALGVMGALVLGPQVLRDFLVNRCRPFIYATAPSPLMAALVRAALLICRFDAARREQPAALVAFAGRAARSAAAASRRRARRSSRSSSAPTSARCSLAAAMQARGFDIRAVRPPTVPEGTARLRLSLTLNVDEAHVAAHGGGARRGAGEARLEPAMTARFVVTGTDTDVGKTVFAAALAAALDGCYWKPVQAGLDGETDAEIVRRLSGAAGRAHPARGLPADDGRLAAPRRRARRHRDRRRAAGAARTTPRPLDRRGRRRSHGAADPAHPADRSVRPLGRAGHPVRLDARSAPSTTACCRSRP